MPVRQIVLTREDANEEWYPAYADELLVAECVEGIDIQHAPILSLEMLANFCDMEAESRNCRDYVGTHRILAALLHCYAGREQATALMHRIAEYGGLDGMAGVGGRISAFADFGIEDCWHGWKLEESEQAHA